MFYTRLISTIALSPGLKERRRETWSSRIISFVTGKGSSEEQEEEMVRLRDENQILSQQLEESKQEIIQTRKQAQRDINQSNSTLNKTQQALEYIMDNYQQEINQSLTRLQKTKVELRDTQVQVQV